MSTHYIRYGIDLGTTNSAIALVDRGTVTMVKNAHQLDTTPSAVQYTRRGIRVGNIARNQWFREHLRNVASGQAPIQTTFVEFKRTMGTDHRYTPSSRPDSRALSEDLSAEVLAELERFARLRGDDATKAAVVTIPAAMGNQQQQATQMAGESAGLEQCHLLQEPVAAAMAFGLEAGRSGDARWLIFDFGGGTFDAALVLTEDGQISVKDTEGDNLLGGKDLDLAVVDRFLIPAVRKDVSVDTLSDRDRQHLRQGLRQFAERARIDLSTRESTFIETDLGQVRLGNGQEIDLDLAISRSEMYAVVEPYFQRAIDKAKRLLGRHGLGGEDLDELILVGGPTHSPILRSMVGDQLRAPNVSVDPMTAVARGAAVYASTVPLKDNIVARAHRRTGTDALALAVEHETTTINHDEFVTIRHRNPGEAARFGRVEVELRREGWASEWLPLATDGTLFEVLLERGRPNTFTISVRTLRGHPVAASPSEFTIVQGVKLTGSPMPQTLGVAAWSEDRTHLLFKTLEGAEKTRLLPVTGVTTLRTTAPIRPGSDDCLRFLILEGDEDAVGKRIAFSAGTAMTLELLGDDLEQVVPANTPLRLSIRTQDSAAAPARVTVFFETLNEEIDVHVPPGSNRKTAPREWVDEVVAEAARDLRTLRDGSRPEQQEQRRIEAELEAARTHFNECVAREDPEGWMQADVRLRETLRQLYEVLDAGEWNRFETELKAVWAELLKGSDGGARGGDPELRELAVAFDAVIAHRDVRLGREVLRKMRRLRYERNKVAIHRGIICWAQKGFANIRWTDRDRARQAVDAAVEAILAGVTDEEVIAYADRVWVLWADRFAQKPDPRGLPQV